MKLKQHELTEALIERNRFKEDIEQVRNQYEAELLRLKREVEQGKQSIMEISTSKGAEVSGIVSKFTAEQAQLEALVQQKQYESDQLRSKLQDFNFQVERMKASHAEELQVLQESLDQALLVLGSFQNQTQSDIGTRDVKITELEAKHSALLYQMMDNMLATCMTTVNDAVFNFDSPQPGPKCAPELILTLIEKAQHSCAEFSTSFIKLVNVILKTLILDW